MNKEAVFSKWFPEKIQARSYLLILGLFFLGSIHYWEPNPGGSGLVIPYNDVSWIVVSLLIGAGLLRIAGSGVLVYSRLTSWLFVSIILLSVPTFYPDSRLINESGFHLGLLAGFLFFLALQQYRVGERDVRLILLLALIGILMEAFIGWQRYLGISWSQMTLDGIGSGIPIGTIRQRNAMSSILVTGLVISAYFLDGKNTQHYASAWKKIAVAIVLLTPVLTLPLIFILKSRTGWLGLAVSAVLIVPYLFRYCSGKLLRLWLVSVVLGCLILPLLNLSSVETEVVPDDKLNWSGPRTYIYNQIIDLAMEKPLLGYGFGNFESEYNLYAATGYAAGKYANPALENLSHPHNELLYWWVEGGIVALAGVLLAALIVIKNILSIHGWSNKLALLALFFPIVLHTQTEHPFYTSLTHWILFLVLILLVDVTTQHHPEKTIGQTLLPSVLGIAIPVLVTVFMLTTLHSGRLLNQVESDMSVDVTILERISNPVVWQDRLQWDMNFGLLALSVYQNKPELARNYIEWASEIIKRKPRAGYYQFLVVAYKVEGDEQMAAMIQKEAEFRFPNRNFNFNLDVFRGIESKNVDGIQPTIVEE